MGHILPLDRQMRGRIQEHTQVSMGAPTQMQHATGKHTQAFTETRMPCINIPFNGPGKKRPTLQQQNCRLAGNRRWGIHATMVPVNIKKGRCWKDF